MMQAIINYAWLELPRERPYSKKFGGKSTRLVCCYLPYPMSRSMTVRTYVQNLPYVVYTKPEKAPRSPATYGEDHRLYNSYYNFSLWACMQAGHGVVVQVQCKVDALVSFRSNGK